MDVKSMRKPKKKRTRRNLNDLRKRSRREVENVNTITDIRLRNIPKYNQNELITCNRLTLALFKKAIRSKTVTRPSYSKFDNTGEVNTKAMNNILTTRSPHPQNPRNGVSINSKKDIQLESSKTHDYGIDINDPDDVGSVTSCSSPQNGFIHLEDFPEQGNFRSDHLINFTSGSSSEAESFHCYYEKFMNELPAHLKVYFPALTSNFVNENVACLKQNCREKYQDKENGLNYNNPSINIPQNERESIIENPMDYIQTGLSWEQSVKNKQSILLSNSSIPTKFSEFGSNNSDIFMNSPDYQYFPHKLNQ